MLGFSSELSMIADDYILLSPAGVICDMDMHSNFGGKNSCCPCLLSFSRQLHEGHVINNNDSFQINFTSVKLNLDLLYSERIHSDQCI